MKTQIDTLANLVRNMRNAQKLYFQSIATAKKTKLPADWATAANALKRSKELEEQVDNTLIEITRSEPPSPPPDREWVNGRPLHSPPACITSK